MQKLHHAIDNLESMAAVRHEEDKMMALTKTALLKEVQTAKNRQMPGFERLPLRDQMRSATYAKEDVVRQLAETLNLDAECSCRTTHAECSCTDATTTVTPGECAV